MTNFTERLSDLIEKNPLSSREIASRCGIHPVYLSQLKTGLRVTKNPELIKKLSKELNCNPSYLLSVDNYENKDKVQESVGRYDEDYENQKEDDTNKEREKLLREMNLLIEALRIAAPNMTTEQLVDLGIKNMNSFDVLKIVVSELHSRGLK